MKILDFEIDVSLLEQNQIKLANIIKSYIFNSNKTLLDLLDFDNDDIFLQPILFYYFFEPQKIKTVSLEQILLGVFTDKKAIKTLRFFSDYNGIIHLPKLGRIIINKKNKSFLLNYHLDRDFYTINNKKVKLFYMILKQLKV